MIPLADALAATYGFAEPPDCERLVRISNDLVRVVTSGGTFWLKLANKVVRPLDDLESEAEVAAALAARRLAVAAPVLRVDGRYVGTLDLREGRCSAVLFHDAPGEELEAAAPAQAEALGALIAKIHLATPVAGAERRWTIDAETLATRPLGWIGPWLLQAGSDVDALTALSDEMGARVWTRDGTTLLPSGLCHGDLQLENARFVGDAPTLFDFEACGVGPYVYDLACYWRKRVALAPPDTPRPEHEWKALSARVRTGPSARCRGAARCPAPRDLARDLDDGAAGLTPGEVGPRLVGRSRLFRRSPRYDPATGRRRARRTLTPLPLSSLRRRSAPVSPTLVGPTPLVTWRGHHYFDGGPRRSVGLGGCRGRSGGTGLLRQQAVVQAVDAVCAAARGSSRAGDRRVSPCGDRCGPGPASARRRRGGLRHRVGRARRRDGAGGRRRRCERTGVDGCDAGRAGRGRRIAGVRGGGPRRCGGAGRAGRAGRRALRRHRHRGRQSRAQLASGPRAGHRRRARPLLGGQRAGVPAPGQGARRAARRSPAGGRVVLFTSGQHRGPMASELPYAVSKGAIHQMTASLADHLAGRGITVNCVNPGPVDTGWAGGELHADIARRFPAGRWGQPDDTARLVAWLVSDEAGWITGQVIDSEGGFRRGSC